MDTLSPDELLPQWQQAQTSPEVMLIQLRQQAIEQYQTIINSELGQDDHSAIKQALPLSKLRQLWQCGDFPTEATIGQILYNLINLQLKIQVLETKIIAMEIENQRLLDHINSK